MSSKVKTNCAYCGELYEVELRIFNWAERYSQKHFCSNECQYSYRRKRIKVNCGTCNSELYKTPSELAKSKSGNLFCNRTCATLYNNQFKVGEKKSNWKGGIGSYRIRAIKYYGAKCDICNYSELEGMLDVHHRDSNRENNSLNNLQVLCVWCHALHTRGFI